MGKAMAFLVFVSCCVSAFCLGALSYTLVTGELPFGITPLQPAEEKEKTEEDKKGEKEEDVPAEGGTIDEQALKSLYKKLQKRLEGQEKKRKKLKQKRQMAEEITNNARSLQERLDEQEKEIRDLVETIDKTEIENVKRLASRIGNAEPAAGVKMLLGMKEDLASRVLYYMSSRKASELISQMMAVDSEEDRKRAVSIIEQARKLAEKKDLEI